MKKWISNVAAWFWITAGERRQLAEGWRDLVDFWHTTSRLGKILFIVVGTAWFAPVVGFGALMLLAGLGTLGVGIFAGDTTLNTGIVWMLGGVIGILFWTLVLTAWVIGGPEAEKSAKSSNHAEIVENDGI